MNKQIPNGIAIQRLRADMSKAELARLVGTTRQQIGRLETGKRKLTTAWAKRLAPALKCTPQDLLFPEMAKVDLNRFHNVFAVAAGDDDTESEPSLSISNEFLSQLLPNAARHNLMLMMIDTADAGRYAAKGDAVIVDLDENRPAKAGLYALNIGGVIQWRFLSPSTTGTIQVLSENPDIPNETVKPQDLNIVGRARLRLSTI